MDRRTTIKWMLAAAASVPSLQVSFAADAGAGVLARDLAPDQKGYGTDPDLMKEWKSGGPWPLTLTANGRQTTKALADLIIPADEHSPAASAVGVVEFIDEWISAPYPQQRGDREIVLPGLAWLEAESQKRFGKGFAAITEPERGAIADDICSAGKARPEFAAAAKFFARFRDLTAGGFYTTPVGMKDIGYTGNTPLAKFDGPPLEALKKAGLA
ncbi:MAG TPA: gluconate 2-dehydrogenase subunit 3 family protein [Steroidobacteraceae bacterium]|nr:gluconate 2-dehydrogenase subunit 3 family protein [Steroidobacteraceae bacterium]